jgi:DNA-binding transcriptional MocR family regulator
VAIDGSDIEAWAARARERGAVMVTAAAFAVDGKPRPFARLGFASLDPEELVDGVRRLPAAHPHPSAKRPRRSRAQSTRANWLLG